MFTGIIEEIGKVKELTRSGKGIVLKIESNVVLDDVRFGDSISTNGVCLTVSEFGPNYFKADVMPESIRMSNLGDLQVGSAVNLERALTLSTRLGGHMVSGHIDGTGFIRRITKESNATWVDIQVPSELTRYIIHKGSISLDGVSLTVANIEGTMVSVSIIPTTKDETTLLTKRVGDKLNIECDLVGKYIEKLTKKNLSPELLKQLGF